MSQYEDKKNSMKKTMEANEHRKQIKCENEAKRFFLTKRQLSFQTAQVLPYGHFKQPHHFQNQNQQWKIMLSKKNYHHESLKDFFQDKQKNKTP